MFVDVVTEVFSSKIDNGILENIAIIRDVDFETLKSQFIKNVEGLQFENWANILKNVNIELILKITLV